MNYMLSVLERKRTNANQTPITFLLPLRFLRARLATWCRKNDSCWPPMQWTCCLFNVEVPPSTHLLLDVALVEIQDTVQFNHDSHCNSLPRGSRAIVSALKDKFLTVPTINRPISTNRPLNKFPSTSDRNLSTAVTYALQLWTKPKSPYPSLRPLRSWIPRYQQYQSNCCSWFSRGRWMLISMCHPWWQCAEGLQFDPGAVHWPSPVKAQATESMVADFTGSGCNRSVGHDQGHHLQVWGPEVSTFGSPSG